jgi:hypothetical protein
VRVAAREKRRERQGRQEKSDLFLRKTSRLLASGGSSSRVPRRSAPTCRIGSSLTSSSPVLSTFLIFLFNSLFSSRCVDRPAGGCRGGKRGLSIDPIDLLYRYEWWAMSRRPVGSVDTSGGLCRYDWWAMSIRLVGYVETTSRLYRDDPWATSIRPVGSIDTTRGLYRDDQSATSRRPVGYVDTTRGLDRDDPWATSSSPARCVDKSDRVPAEVRTCLV